MNEVVTKPVPRRGPDIVLRNRVGRDAVHLHPQADLQRQTKGRLGVEICQSRRWGD